MMQAYRVEAVAKLLDCSKRHVYDLVASGELPAFKIGRRGIRITDEAVRAWVARSQSLTQSTASPSAGETDKPLPISAMKLVGGIGRG